MTTRRTRVVQWATGNIGLRTLREVIRHPDLELVGVLVYDPAKEGVDAGVLCGEEPVGVLATTDGDAVHALAADCVLYMPRALELDDVVRFLESGTNVVTTRGELFGGGRPLGDEGRAARARCMCARQLVCLRDGQQSRLHHRNPLPFALLSLQRRVESIQIDEFANVSRRNSPNMLFVQMGFGRTLDSFDPGRASYLLAGFAPSLGTLAEAAGRPVDEWTATGEVAARAPDHHDPRRRDRGRDGGGPTEHDHRAQ